MPSRSAAVYRAATSMPSGVVHSGSGSLLGASLDVAVDSPERSGRLREVGQAHGTGQVVEQVGERGTGVAGQVVGGVHAGRPGDGERFGQLVEAPVGRHRRLHRCRPPTSADPANASTTADTSMVDGPPDGVEPGDREEVGRRRGRSRPTQMVNRNGPGTPPAAVRLVLRSCRPASAVPRTRPPSAARRSPRSTSSVGGSAVGAGKGADPDDRCPAMVDVGAASGVALR